MVPYSLSASTMNREHLILTIPTVTKKHIHYIVSILKTGEIMNFEKSKHACVRGNLYSKNQMCDHMYVYMQHQGTRSCIVCAYVRLCICTSGFQRVLCSSYIYLSFQMENCVRRVFFYFEDFSQNNIIHVRMCIQRTKYTYGNFLFSQMFTTVCSFQQTSVQILNPTRSS